MAYNLNNTKLFSAWGYSRKRSTRMALYKTVSTTNTANNFDPFRDAYFGDLPSQGNETNITVGAAFQAQSGDAVNITAIYPLSIAQGNQAVSGNSVSVSGIHLVSITEGNQSQTGEAVNITPLYPVLIGQGAQTVTGDAISLSASVPEINLTVSEATQSQSGDAILLYAVTTIVPSASTQSVAGDTVNISGIYPVAQIEGSQAVLGDAIIIDVNNPQVELPTEIQPVSGAQSVTGDAVQIAPIYVILMASAMSTWSSDLMYVFIAESGPSAKMTFRTKGHLYKTVGEVNVEPSSKPIATYSDDVFSTKRTRRRTNGKLF